jgi:5'-deoxynucleotidase YfbR-like HD superfamily hydrolase
MTSELDFDAVVRFTFELGQLRQEVRHGWLRIYENPESVAEHSQRAACLGYLLAHCERFEDPHLVATMILFHDIHEVRVGDADRVQRQYVQLAEDEAVRDQTDELGAAGAAIARMWKAVDTQATVAGTLAKEAEILEMVFTARELIVRGNRDAQLWIDTAAPRIQTQSGRKLLELINAADPGEWWKRVGGLWPGKWSHCPVIRRTAVRSWCHGESSCASAHSSLLCPPTPASQPRGPITSRLSQSSHGTSSTYPAIATGIKMSAAIPSRTFWQRSR